MELIFVYFLKLKIPYELKIIWTYEVYFPFMNKTKKRAEIRKRLGKKTEIIHIVLNEITKTVKIKKKKRRKNTHYRKKKQKKKKKKKKKTK